MDQLRALARDTKKPVFYYYYFPGDGLSREMRKAMLQTADKYHEQVHHTWINCSTHFSQCQERSIVAWPLAEVLLPPVTKIDERGNSETEYPVLPMVKDYSLYGFECLYRVSSITLNPNLTLIGNWCTPAKNPTQRFARFAQFCG